MVFLRGDESDGRRVEKLTRITDVLAERVGRLEETRGSAWSMFQAAVALEQEVLARTRESLSRCWPICPSATANWP